MNNNCCFTKFSIDDSALSATFKEFLKPQITDLPIDKLGRRRYERTSVKSLSGAKIFSSALSIDQSKDESDSFSSSLYWFRFKLMFSDRFDVNDETIEMNKTKHN